jgi:hypothetical protein
MANTLTDVNQDARILKPFSGCRPESTAIAGLELQ